ncbi:M20 family metallopeptidase [Streptomyces sp. NPDC049040]|uniref:M20 metallopeptidase family protein n=1 Tax=Streptomyces sp. NPDC049040 TaxID=3365593 RepID=UPI0037180388
MPTAPAVPPAPGHAELGELAAGIDGELVALRRTLHRHPELAGQERRTAALVAGRLRAAGLTVTTGVGGHGVVAVLDRAGEGPTVAYRADMDAVPADEEPAEGFSSRVPGAAHLCGHDLHVAIGVGIARVLARVRERLGGRVVFVFQPAEETLAGARAMIEDGVLDRTRPREIHALHCGPLPVGAFAVMPGFGHPGLDRFTIDVPGPGAEAGGRRLRAMVDGLSTTTPPRTPEDRARLVEDLTTPDGPLARFVLAGSSLAPAPGGVRVSAWLRAWPDSRYSGIRDAVRRAVESAPGARVTFAGEPFPSMVCSPELSEAAAAHLREAYGPDAVTVLHASFPFAGEDFGLFLRRVPGAMYFLGVADPASGVNGAPHAPDFVADERAIRVGVQAMAGFLSSRLAAQP